MEHQNIIFQRQRNFGEIFNATFGFVRQEFSKFMRSLIYFSGPFILMGTMFFGYSQISMFAIFDDANISEFAGSYMFGAIFMFLAFTMLIDTVLAYVDIYNLKGANNFEIEDVWKIVRKNFFKVLGTNILLTLIYVPIFAISILMLGIPIIYVSVVTLFIYPIQYFEGLSFGNAFSKSFKLVKNRWFFTFGLILVCGLVLNFLTSAASLPLSIISGAVSYGLGVEDGEGYMKIGLIVYYALAIISTYILISVIYLTVIVNYFNLIEEKEHRYLFKKIEEI